MKVTIELNRVKVTKDIPISWDQVNFGQFLELSEAGKDIAKILSVFTGVEAETIRKAKIHNLDSILKVISFIEKENINSKIPDEILGHKIPQNLQFESIGQFEDLKLEAAKIKDNTKESLMAYTKFCAIYATNPYDYKEAEKLAPTFLGAPCGEVVAIGNFTLLKLIESNDITLSKALQQRLHPKKWKLALIAWLARLGFTVRFYLWKRKLRSLERSF